LCPLTGIVCAADKGLISWATSMVGDDNVTTFPYDWRRDYGETADKLIEFMTATSKKYGGDALQVVAHGDGGLIAFAAMSLETRHLFESCIFIGTAFGPSLNESLQMLHTDNPLKGMEKVLRPKIMTSFPSSYVHFPSPADRDAWKNVGYGQDTVNPTEFIEENWFQLSTWERYSIGPWAYGDVPAEQRRHVDNCLEASRQFRMRLRHNIKLPYPPLVCVMGDAEQTRAMVKITPPNNATGAYAAFDFETVEWVFGDGRVPCDHAVPARGVTHVVQMCSRKHDDLVTDKKALTTASETIYTVVSAKKIVAHKAKKKDNKRDEKRMEEEENRQHALWLKWELKPKDVFSVLDMIESEMGTHDEDEPPPFQDTDIEVVVGGEGDEFGMEVVSNPMFGDIDMHKVEEDDLRDGVRDKVHGLLADEHGGKKMRHGQQNQATKLSGASTAIMDNMLDAMREADAGDGKRYKVLAPAQLREGVSRDSEKCGQLNIGEIHTAVEEVTDDEGLRVRFGAGWTSEYAANGTRMLGEVKTEGSGVKFMGRDGAWGARHSKEGKRVGKADKHEDIFFNL
jgi:hypothetical protein